MYCSNRSYHYNEVGFSRPCHCQDAVHLTFGNVSLLLSKLQIKDFTTYISETLITERDVEDHDSRCIHLPTRDQCLMFSMSYNELKKLFEILENTCVMIEVEDALNMNNN